MLAVSGGLDSMVLLDAAAAVAPDRIAAVATFDHRTGAAAVAASALVADAARALHFDVVIGYASDGGTSAASPASESSWRDARWRFLTDVAVQRQAVVVTAHTRDDQVETVLMRVLRGTGARGLAALAADGRALRPLLDFSRATLARYAGARSLRWVEDPSNASRRYLRNRVRLELLPALERARPGLSDEIQRLGVRAADLRRQVDQVARTMCDAPAGGDAGATIARVRLTGYDEQALALLWPALAARAGVTLDRRGTARLVRFTTTARHGRRVQLSGGWEVLLHRDRFLVRRSEQRGA